MPETNADNLDVIQARLGSEEAFTRLVERYQIPVFNLCCRMLGDPDLAEEAAQESFWRAYRSLEKCDPQRSFATWLLSIAAHYCIDQLRRRRFSFVSIDQMVEDDDYPVDLPDGNAPNPEAEIEKREQERAVQRLLAGLEPADRAAVVLRYWYDFSEAEIARSLNKSVPAVKSRLFRARRQMALGMGGDARQSPAGTVRRADVSLAG